MVGGIKRSEARSILVLAVLIALAGCSLTHPAQPQQPISESGATIVPLETKQDWVTYGDVLMAFRVTSEKEIPPSKEEVDRGEGTITRQVTAQQSEGDVLWTRPSRSSDQPLPVSTWTIADGGWIFHGNDRQPLTVAGREPLTVGGEYIAIRTFARIGGDDTREWFSMQYLPVQDARIHFSDTSVLIPDLKSVQDLSVTDFIAMLNKVPPDPRAVPYMSLDPVDRYHRVVDA